MSQKRWSGLTAALVVSTFSLVPVSRAEHADLTARVEPDAHSSDTPVLPDLDGDPKLLDPVTVVKVGALQSEDRGEPTLWIAQVVPHRWDEYQAATVYVRNIPVLTFLATTPSPTSELSSVETVVQIGRVFLASTTQVSGDKTVTPLKPALDPSRKLPSGSQSSSQTEQDPVWRATSLAALLNYLYRQGMDAETIAAYWDPEEAAYVIYLGNQELVRFNNFTLLADTTDDPEQDALQAANRLRRLLGSAPPLRQVSLLPARRDSNLESTWVEEHAGHQTISGWASWYGPGFHGARSASGEIFDPNAMTAAHPWLPFGTQVRVTNLDNGQSVVVRINDRGPYVGDRILDLSAAAAEFLGMIYTGVAPVRVDILNEVN